MIEIGTPAIVKRLANTARAIAAAKNVHAELAAAAYAAKSTSPSPPAPPAPPAAGGSTR